LPNVTLNDLSNQLFYAPPTITIPNIIDSQPYTKQSITSLPLGITWLRTQTPFKLLHLVDQALDCWLIRFDERGIYRGAARGEVEVVRKSRIVVFY